MLVSVIIPNYNHAKYLTQRIDSVLGQSFQDFELIIMDDCSTDNSKSIIEKYRSDSRVSSIIYNETNSGSTFRQWNKGLSIARGSYIWIAESDDTCAPTFLETMIKVLSTCPKASMAYSNSYRIDESGQVHGIWNEAYNKPEFDKFKDNFIMDGAQMAASYMSYMNIVPNASAVVFRKTAAEAAGGAPEDFRLVGDWIFWIRLMLLGEVIYFARPLNYFRFHNATVRKLSERNGTALYEATHVIKFLKSKVAIDPLVNDDSLKYLLWMWRRACIAGQLSVRQKYDMYQAIRELYPGAGFLIAREYINNVLRIYPKNRS